MIGFRPIRAKGLAVASLVVTTTLLSAPAHGFERVAEGVAFHIKCFGLMISNPAEHVAVCNPVMREPGVLVQGGSGAAPAPAPVVVPPPPPAPPAPGGFA